MSGTFDSRSQEEEFSSDEGVVVSGIGGSSSGHPEDAPEESGADVLKIASVPDLDRLYGLREVGPQALCWQLSSAKPGNGVEQIRDASTTTYWQSDGPAQPHWIQVRFARRVALSHVCLYLDYPNDESYTPKTVHVQAGTTSADLQPAHAASEVEFHEPQGWCVIPLQAPADPLSNNHHAAATTGNNALNENASSLDNENDNHSDTNEPSVVRAHFLRISILGMHQNGRDTHVRQVQLYGPRGGAMPSMAAAAAALNNKKHNSFGVDAARNANDDDDDDDDDMPFMELGPLSSHPLVIR